MEAGVFWQPVKAARSAYTHLFIDLEKLNAVSCPPSRHRLASSHCFTSTTSTNLILVTGMTGLPPLLLGDHVLPHKLYCARWQKNNWNFSITIKDQTTLLQLQSLKGTDVEPSSYLPNAITTPHRETPSNLLSLNHRPGLLGIGSNTVRWQPAFCFCCHIHSNIAADT